MSNKTTSQTLVLQPTSMAQWHALIEEARVSSAITLSEDLESYLILLLMRFCSDPEIANSVFALDFLQNQSLLNRENRQVMRDVGDKCLLFSGLFPETAERKRVHISYYVKLGQSAYSSLSASDSELSQLYDKLCHHFVGLMDVLLTMRSLDPNATPLNLLEAEDLWHSTQSAHALSILRNATQGFLVPRNVILPEHKH